MAAAIALVSVAALTVGVRGLVWVARPLAAMTVGLLLLLLMTMMMARACSMEEWLRCTTERLAT